MILDDYVKNKIKIEFILKKSFYPSENLDLVVLEYNEKYCACELYYKDGSVRGWRTFYTEDIIEYIKKIREY